MEKPLITIPEKDTPVTGMPEEVKNRFDKRDTILITVVVAVVIALIAILISVFGIFLDQMRYNNAAYKDYSDRLQSVGQTQKSNDVLLKQTDLQQKQIIDLQNQIKNLLNK
jgi:predicted PurR-regulated permease PerM